MTKDLTTGKIMPILVNFTVPLVLGNLFQLTYNAVDSIIVGHFVGKEALAAVGICNPISTLMILFLNGLCMGASILMGIQYGAKDYKTLHRQISTTMLSGVVFSFFLTLFCVVFAVPILHLLQVDASIMEMTRQYLRIIFLGLMFTFLYNFFSSIPAGSQRNRSRVDERPTEVHRVQLRVLPQALQYGLDGGAAAGHIAVLQPTCRVEGNVRQ